MSAVICEEIKIFGMVLLEGMLLAGSYDILRIMRAVFVHARWVTDGEDILFWIIWFVYLVDYWYYGSYGTMRGFVILALVIGIGFYEKLCSRYVVSFFSHILRRIRDILHRIFCKIFHLFKKLTKHRKNNTIKSGRLLWRRGVKNENTKKGSVPKEKATE